MMCLVKMAMGMFFKAVAMLMPNEVAGQGLPPDGLMSVARVNFD